MSPPEQARRQDVPGLRYLRYRRGGCGVDYPPELVKVAAQVAQEGMGATQDSRSGEGLEAAHPAHAPLEVLMCQQR